MILHSYLQQSFESYPDHLALIEPSGAEISYRGLTDLADRLRDRLHLVGVRPGDRVGMYLPKTIDAIATIFGILQTGAAYVPLDSGAPVTRNAYITADCDVKAIVVMDRVAESLRAELASHGKSPTLLVVENAGGGQGLSQMLADAQAQAPAPNVETVIPDPDSLAYILYTSGSTGRPKGVMHTHRSAASFVEWCSDVFQPTSDDRFSSHAPFHFDLSIHDIYTPIKHGASLVIIDEATGKQPFQLAALIADHKISIWYSTPSILNLLAQFGKLDKYNYDALRIVLFAGEVFPIQQLRHLTEKWPAPRYFNLYGPTETNVCTWYEVELPISPEQDKPFPIGPACAHCEAIVVDENDQIVPDGEEGELLIYGPPVMTAYWNLPERTAAAFFVDDAGKNWYHTGDIVQDIGDGVYDFRGRRDRMVKKRGYRVELGEVESAMYRHPAVEKAAVIAVSHDTMGLLIKAFLCCKDGQNPNIIELKTFYSDHLPTYMIPDIFSFQDSLPHTSTDKIDYQKLKQL